MDKPSTEASLSSNNIEAVWFEAWRYQHEAVPIVALLHEIREQIDLWGKFKNNSKKIGHVTLLGALSAFDETIKAASGGLFAPKTAGLQKMGNTYEQSRYQHTLNSETIQELLE